MQWKIAQRKLQGYNRFKPNAEKNKSKCIWLRESYKDSATLRNLMDIFSFQLKTINSSNARNQCQKLKTKWKFQSINIAPFFAQQWRKMIVRLTEKQFSMLVYTAAYTINIYRLDHQSPPNWNAHFKKTFCWNFTTKLTRSKETDSSEEEKYTNLYKLMLQSHKLQ